MGFDKEQYHMVSEALQERANLVDIAPHLAYALPIMLPVYAYWQIPYYWAGIKVRIVSLFDCIRMRNEVFAVGLSRPPFLVQNPGV